MLRDYYYSFSVLLFWPIFGTSLHRLDRLVSCIGPKWYLYLIQFFGFALLLAYLSAVAVSVSNNFAFGPLIPPIATILFAILLQHHEHVKNRVASTVLLLFWLSMIILDSFKVRSFAIRATNVPDYYKHHWISVITLLFELSAILIIFSLELTSKPKYLYVTPGEDDNPCPEITANIFSLLSFHWMDPLMKLGYSKDLEMDDLWSLKRRKLQVTIQKYSTITGTSNATRRILRLFVLQSRPMEHH